MGIRSLKVIQDNGDRVELEMIWIMSVVLAGISVTLAEHGVMSIISVQLEIMLIILVELEIISLSDM